MLIRLTVALLMVVLAMAPSYAQEQPVEQAQSVEQFEPGDDVSGEPVSDAIPEAESEEVSASGNVSLDFRDADVQNVLRILSYKSGVNIVPGPEVTGLVTIKLKDVPWKRALEVVLETYGYGYEQKDNIITVTTIENLKNGVKTRSCWLIRNR